MLHNDKKYIYALAFFYSILIVIMLSIPTIFYIAIEKQNYRQNQLQSLEHYTYGVEKSIYNFSRTQEKIFDFPRSIFYTSSLYDNANVKLFSTDDTVVEHTREEIRKKITLSTNRLKAKYLVVTQPFTYKEIYMKALLFALFMGVVIFLMSIFFIKISLRPLERVNRYLNTFFNDAMHELKTPLGVMQLNLEMLQKEKRNKIHTRLFNSMQNMILIYDDIEYHIKHTHVTYTPEDIDFSYFLQNRIEIFSDIARIKNIVIHKEISANISLHINRIELQRIIDNTLSNAIKYSPNGTKIDIKLYREDSHIIFSVADEGVGIQDTQKIFERYARENTIQGGFGIGLSIVKHICNKNNIKIFVKSRRPKGSLFRYTFS